MKVWACSRASSCSFSVWSALWCSSWRFSSSTLAGRNAVASASIECFCVLIFFFFSSSLLHLTDVTSDTEEPYWREREKNPSSSWSSHSSTKVHRIFEYYYRKNNCVCVQDLFLDLDINIRDLNRQLLLKHIFFLVFYVGGGGQITIVNLFFK